MGNVKVRIKPAIAAAGCGFCERRKAGDIPSPRRAESPLRRGVRSLCLALRGAEDRLGSSCYRACWEAARPSAPRPGAVVVSVNGEHVAEFEIAADATRMISSPRSTKHPTFRNV